MPPRQVPPPRQWRRSKTLESFRSICSLLLGISIQTKSGQGLSLVSLLFYGFNGVPRVILNLWPTPRSAAEREVMESVHFRSTIWPSTPRVYCQYMFPSCGLFFLHFFPSVSQTHFSMVLTLCHPPPPSCCLLSVWCMIAAAAAAARKLSRAHFFMSLILMLPLGYGEHVSHSLQRRERPAAARAIFPRGSHSTSCVRTRRTRGRNPAFVVCFSIP